MTALFQILTCKPTIFQMNELKKVKVHILQAMSEYVCTYMHTYRGSLGQLSKVSGCVLCEAPHCRVRYAKI